MLRLKGTVINETKLLIFCSCILVGIEPAQNLAPELLNEGSKYLSDLICNKVCRARKTRQSDSNKVPNKILQQIRDTFLNKLWFWLLSLCASRDILSLGTLIKFFYKVQT